MKALNLVGTAIDRVSNKTKKLGCFMEENAYTHEDLHIYNYHKNIISNLKRSHIFSLPKHGKILGGYGDSIANTEVYVPYDIVSLEYKGNDGSGNIILIEKRQVQDIFNDSLIDYRKSIENRVKDHKYLLHIHFLADLKGDTVLIPFSVFMAADWSKDDVFGSMEEKSFITTRGNKNLKAGIVDYLTFQFMPCTEGISMDGYAEYMRQGTTSIIELCEALSCSNVQEKVIQKRTPLTKKDRKKKGYPILETKVLEIEVPANNWKGDYFKGNGTSPRQHLRRGHIRRLKHKDGTPNNIWINSCSVGDPSKGRITKSYKVTT